MFHYGGGFENYYQMPECPNLVRDGSLVMTIFATWCAAEEMYVLSPEIAIQLKDRIEHVDAQDCNHEKLLNVTTFGLELFIEEPSYHSWWKGDLWKFDRDSRWVLKEIVRSQLDLRDTLDNNALNTKPR